LKNLSLTYCTNVHPLGDWAGWSDIIGRFGPAVRQGLGWPEMPLGLWFPASLIEEMNRDPRASRERLKDLLAERNLSAFTCNAFPYGNFHDKSVKTKVYKPDWTTPERLAYSVACARLLAAVMPAGAEGSVSTLPLGWRVGWTAEHSRKSAENLCAFAIEARALEGMDGRTLRLGLEPEPGCALETLGQVLAFWSEHLRPAAQRAGLTPEDLSRFLGICYDTCHQAVQFEDPVDTLDRLRVNGIPVVKMQLSSALEFRPDPERATLGLRRQFVEDRFLHQTRVKTPAGVAVFDDLPDALAEGAALREALAGGREEFGGIDPWAHPWRVHYHLPIESRDMLDSGVIATTRDDMLKAFHHALAERQCHHFEIETYTWSVLPMAHRPADDAALAQCLVREVKFIEANTPAGFGINGQAPGPGARAGGSHA
jgi:sugar phosphate isomerase/epimerase